MSASSNHFFEVLFANMNLTGPNQRPLPEEIAVLDRGNLDTNAHYVQGTDAVVMAPLQVTFTADIDDTTNKQSLRDALGNPDRKSPWTVNALSFAKTNGLSKIYSGSGTLVSVPAPFNSAHERIDLVMLWRGGTPGTNDIGIAYREVWFPPDQQRLTESEQGVQMACTGFCYGAISWVTTFSAGSAV